MPTPPTTTSVYMCVPRLHVKCVCDKRHSSDICCAMEHLLAHSRARGTSVVHIEHVNAPEDLISTPSKVTSAHPPRSLLHTAHAHTHGTRTHTWHTHTHMANGTLETHGRRSEETHGRRSQDHTDGGSTGAHLTALDSTAHEKVTAPKRASGE